jgi:hypothetical protein
VSATRQPHQMQPAFHPGYVGELPDPPCVTLLIRLSASVAIAVWRKILARVSSECFHPPFFIAAAPFEPVTLSTAQVQLRHFHCKTLVYLNL